MTQRHDQETVPTYRLYREQLGESGDFWLHCETIPERTQLHNWQIALHRHEAFFQIFSVSHGSGELIGSGSRESRTFAAPCVLFIPPGAAHGFDFSRDIDGVVVTALADRLGFIAATDRAIADFLGATRVVPVDGGDKSVGVGECLSRIHGEIGARRAGRAVLLEALVSEAVVALARAGRRSSGAPAATGSPGPTQRDLQRLDDLDDLISAHFREHRPIAFYAARLGMSASHLNRLCRRHFGGSVQARIARRVMEAARRDLIFTPTPIQAIAISLGFQDPAYFNRFFRRMSGTTPGTFREEERRKLAG